MGRTVCFALFSLLTLTLPTGVAAAENRPHGPYDRQVAENLVKLESDSAADRAGAAEALGFLRAYTAEDALVRHLNEKSVEPRRQTAMALAWCGGRKAVGPLLAALDDPDWAVRQAAHVSLTNLTGMEFPFDALAAIHQRETQANAWRQWWAMVPEDRPPKEVLTLLDGYPSPTLQSEAPDAKPEGEKVDQPIQWRLERGLRALGALGGKGASQAVLDVLGQKPPEEPPYRPMVRAGLRALGRLDDQPAFDALVGYLDNTMWARAAADALGDFGDRRAVGPLLDAYPDFAKQLDGKYPPRLPADDNWGGPPSDVAEDRMLETAYWISYALSRLPLDGPADRSRLGRLAPLIMANLPRDHDRAMLYQKAAPAMLTRHLMEASRLRQEACEHAFTLLGQPRRVPRPIDFPDGLQWPVPPGYAAQSSQDREALCASTWLPALCTDPRDVPRLIGLLEHEEGLVRINAAKTLAWLPDERAVEPIARLLSQAKAEADFGYCGTFKFDEYNDPTPRWREAFARALGLLGAQEHTALLVRIMRDDRSSLGVRYAAAHALGDLLAGGENRAAAAALDEAAAGHVFQSVRHLACDLLRREGLRQSRVSPLPRATPPARPIVPEETASEKLEAIVFLKGDNLMHNDVGTVELADRWRRTYVYSDPGPTYRPAQNLYILRPPRPDGTVTPLTTFADGYVADPEISWDAGEMIFSRRGQDDPWWHVWRIKLDGSGLRQVTRGPHHDVGPAYLPDGRIVFSSTRSGIRDEYHGYQCNALYVMNRDGTRMERIATNAGRDNEPAVLADGRVAFCRLEMFYARIKTELTLHAVHADGTQDVVLYGPARREYWHELDYGPRSRLGHVENPTLFGVLRMTQPQAMPDGRRIVVATQAGLALVGGRRDTEQIVTPDNKTRVYTTPFPLPDGRLLCSAGAKEFDRAKIDLGLYLVDPATRDVELIYNDPGTADFEARPVLIRRPPSVQSARANPNAYSGRFVCESVFTTQEEEVARRGRLIRLIEGMPVVGRHSTHTNPWPIWKNHHGLFARVLGTFPLAADGSFSVEVPADRLMHFQVLDSDRRVVGNQLTWIYPRGGETKSCVGCHENPHTTTRGKVPLALRAEPARFLPHGDEFNYRAKSWMKGYLPPEVEERMRTVRAVNLLGR